MSRILGIDLGTTTSSMAIIEGGEATILANAEGKRTTPSIVAFAKDGSTIVGEVAARQQTTNPERTIAEVKRHMATNWTINIDGETYTPEKISALILSKLKKDAEDFLGEAITRAVITVPAYFNDAERKATRDAGRIAGLEVERIVNEPTAAALAYGVSSGSSQKVLVYDLGGGTFDVSLLDVDSDDTGGSIEVLATTGDNQLGGKDFNEALARYLAQAFLDKHGIDLMADTTSRVRLVDAAETAKIELSAAPSAHVSLPYITATDSGPLNLDMTITREEFEDVAMPLIERTGPLLSEVVTNAGLTMAEVDTILLVGGSTRMPIVEHYVSKTVGRPPSKTVNPDEVVASGAALQGEIVSSGGTIKGRDMVLIDRLALSFGVEAAGGRFVPVVSKGSTVPASATAKFSTAEDGQDSVFVQIFQGDRALTKDCKKLGDFELGGIIPAPAGVPQIEVSFNVDVDSNLAITARDLTSGTEQSIRISGASGMSEAEIQQAMRDAEANRAKDEELKAAHERQARIERTVRQGKKLMSDYPDNPHATSVKEALTQLEADGSEDNLDKAMKVIQEFGASVIRG